ncbi:MAG TPA: hypothetical protein VFU19_01780, partial [Iamia sp.]|nr:hypothetical protein [Iamia sp.]
MSIDATLALLRRELGAPFLTYVLNIGDYELAAFAGGMTPVPDAHHRPIGTMSALIVHGLGEHHAVRRFAFEGLVQHVATESTSWATATRRALGGDVDPARSDEPLEDVLLTLVRDLYPAFLIPQPLDEWGP